MKMPMFTCLLLGLALSHSVIASYRATDGESYVEASFLNPTPIHNFWLDKSWDKKLETHGHIEFHAQSGMAELNREGDVTQGVVFEANIANLDLGLGEYANEENRYVSFRLSAASYSGETASLEVPDLCIEEMFFSDFIQGMSLSDFIKQKKQNTLVWRFNHQRIKVDIFCGVLDSEFGYYFFASPATEDGTKFIIDEFKKRKGVVWIEGQAKGIKFKLPITATGFTKAWDSADDAL